MKHQQSDDPNVEVLSAPKPLPQVGIGCLMPMRGEVVEACPDGRLLVKVAEGRVFTCDWLESHLTLGKAVSAGDAVLIMADQIGATGILVGRVGPRQGHSPDGRLTIEASQQLTFLCGAASIDLRADGKVMVRGEDVLLRAKGTQRIRAGTVSIN
jgi:hypothetical protein